MNKQKENGGIEWTKPYGRTGYTWNTVGGCQHGCEWVMEDGSKAECYAKSIAERFTSAYPKGFEHHYWRPHKLNDPLKVKEPSGIFLDSMSDLMGHWVKDEQIQQVLDICSDASQHIFFLLTKNAVRLPKFKYPKNVWVGVSSPPDFYMGKELSANQRNRMLKTSLKSLGQVNASVRWMSFEPLNNDYSHIVEDYEGVINWAVIGAMSKGREFFPPHRNDFDYMMTVLDNQSIPVFFKGNMSSLITNKSEWRDEFPPEQKQLKQRLLL